MKKRHFGIAAGSIVAMCGLVVACSDDDSGSSSGGSSGTTSSSGGSTSSSGGSSTSSSSSSSSSGGGGACEIAPGTYKASYTKTGGDANCQAPADQTFEIKASDGGTGQDAGVNPDCKVTTDEASCSSVIECTTKQSGFTTTTKSTFSAKTLKGTTDTKTVKDDDNSVLVDCQLEYTWTKQ